ncbi:MAG: hypothetical protein QM346_13695 [Chloroflexota bacterium]|nr:hypothetical protein [Chloroflexota bacterium]
MTLTDLLSNFYAPYAAAGIIGLLIGWLFTRIGWRRRINEAEERAAELDAQRRRIERQSAESIEKAARLESSATAAEEQLAELRGKAESLAAELAAAQEEKADLAAQLEACASETADLKMQLALQQDAPPEGDPELVRAGEEVELAQPQPEPSVSATEMEQLRAELDQARARADKADQAAMSKDTALTEAYERAVALQRQLDEREKKLAAAQAELEGLRHEIAALSDVKEEMEFRIQRARADAAGELASLTSTMMKLKDDALHEANARIAELTKELEQARDS